MALPKNFPHDDHPEDEHERHCEQKDLREREVGVGEPSNQDKVINGKRRDQRR